MESDLVEGVRASHDRLLGRDDLQRSRHDCVVLRCQESSFPTCLLFLRDIISFLSEISSEAAILFIHDGGVNVTPTFPLVEESVSQERVTKSKSASEITGVCSAIVNEHATPLKVDCFSPILVYPSLQLAMVSSSAAFPSSSHLHSCFGGPVQEHRMS